MASPHVAAVAALVQSALIAKGKDPLAPAAMRTLLKETARPFPVSIPTATPIGTGIVDAKAALAKALEEPCTENCGPVATPLTNKIAVGGAERYGRQQPPVQLRGSRRKAAQRDHLRWHRQRVGLHRPGT